jgi:hypothetical protein
LLISTSPDVSNYIVKVRRCPIEGRNATYACSVHANIDPPCKLLCFGKQRLEALLITHVSFDGNALKLLVALMAQGKGRSNGLFCSLQVEIRANQ